MMAIFSHKSHFSHFSTFYYYTTDLHKDIFWTFSCQVYTVYTPSTHSSVLEILHTCVYYCLTQICVLTHFSVYTFVHTCVFTCLIQGCVEFCTHFWIGFFGTSLIFFGDKFPNNLIKDENWCTHLCLSFWLQICLK